MSIEPTQLKPCPFCGSEAKIIAPLGYGNVRACECSNADCAATGPWIANEAEAIAAWNTRHSAPAGGVELRTIYVQWTPNGTIRKWDWDEFELAERLKVETAPVSDKPIGWMYAYHPKPPETRAGAIEFKRDRTKLPLDKRWTETPLYTHPAPPADVVEALRAAKAAMDEYYRYWTGGETRGSYDGKPERAALWAARERARTALAKHGGA